MNADTEGGKHGPAYLVRVQAARHTVLVHGTAAVRQTGAAREEPACVRVRRGAAAPSAAAAVREQVGPRAHVPTVIDEQRPALDRIPAAGRLGWLVVGFVGRDGRQNLRPQCTRLPGVPHFGPDNVFAQQQLRLQIVPVQAEVVALGRGNAKKKKSITHTHEQLAACPQALPFVSGAPCSRTGKGERL